MSDVRLYWCKSCGMVREATVAPWCRHGDIALAARRMVPVKDSHPMAGAKSSDPGMEWLAHG